jgi:GNAT superfamily N-acetyltransferase
LRIVVRRSPVGNDRDQLEVGVGLAPGEQEVVDRVEICPATPKDIPQLVMAFEWLFAPPGKRPASWGPKRAQRDLDQLLKSSSATILLAAEGARVVGFATVYRDLDSIRLGPRGWVEDLAVHPERRSRGIGKRLLESSRERARRAGASRVGLESGEARLDAPRVYLRERPTAVARSFPWML